MKRETNTKESIYGCVRCNKNINLGDIDSEFIGCPRGGCEAEEIGEVEIKQVITIKVMNEKQLWV